MAAVRGASASEPSDLPGRNHGGSSPGQRSRSRARKVAKRVGIGVAGVALLLAGGAMLLLPGPGLLVIAAGLAVLATEFDWAERSLQRCRDKLSEQRARATSRWRRSR